MKIVPTKLKKNQPELTLNYKDKLLNKKQNPTYKMPANDKTCICDCMPNVSPQVHWPVQAIVFWFNSYLLSSFFLTNEIAILVRENI